MPWKKGPMPAGTFNWGGVVTKDCPKGGFYFADFRGDHVLLNDGRRIEAADVVLYDNELEVPTSKDEQ